VSGAGDPPEEGPGGSKREMRARIEYGRTGFLGQIQIPPVAVLAPSGRQEGKTERLGP
jgi:hypothetical protein